MIDAGLASPAALRAAAARPGSTLRSIRTATGIPPSAAARRLVLGQEVVHRERITTGIAGQTPDPVSSINRR